jgi:caffeoyl-CoA O-methyltransferase
MADVDSRSGARYADPAILAYVERVHVAHDAALARAFTAPAAHGLPEIQVSPSEGRFLGLLVSLLGARNVIEVGTLAGYSAIHIGRALAPGGKLYTLENEPKHAQVARDNIAAAGLADRIEVRLGDALQSLQALEVEAPFDAVFLDADKESYPKYAAWAARHLRRGGILLADNSYFFGQLLAEESSARAMRRFHEQLASDFESVCVPTPDGLVFAIRR